MEKNFNALIEHSKRAVRYWWLLLPAGFILLLLGVYVIVRPEQSYLGMSVLFGWIIFAIGVLEIILAASNRHYITGRGWMLAGGIIEAIIGLILIFNVALSAATMPIVLGFWLLFRGFSAIGLGGDMHALRIGGSGWTIVAGVLLLICGLWILMQPIVFGTTAVILWVGISLLVAGAAAIWMAFQLCHAHKCVAAR